MKHIDLSASKTGTLYVYLPHLSRSSQTSVLFEHKHHDDAATAIHSTLVMQNSQMKPVTVYGAYRPLHASRRKG